MVSVKVKDRKFSDKYSPTYLAWRAKLPWLQFDGLKMFCTLRVSRLAKNSSNIFGVACNMADDRTVNRNDFQLWLIVVHVKWNGFGKRSWHV
jgi:hypothetical protein